MKARFGVFFVLLFLIDSHGLSSQTKQQHPKDESTTLIIYDLARDASNWEERLNQFRDLLQRKYPQDTLVKQLLDDANQQLLEIKKSASALIKKETLAETVALSFELQALSKDLAVLGVQLLNRGFETSPGLQASSSNWSQTTLDVRRELKKYDDGFQSHAYAMAQEAEKALAQCATKK